MIDFSGMLKLVPEFKVHDLANLVLDFKQSMEQFFVASKGQVFDIIDQVNLAWFLWDHDLLNHAIYGLVYLLSRFLVK